MVFAVKVTVFLHSILHIHVSEGFIFILIYDITRDRLPVTLISRNGLAVATNNQFNTTMPSTNL